MRCVFALCSTCYGGLGCSMVATSAWCYQINHVSPVHTPPAHSQATDLTLLCPSAGMLLSEMAGVAAVLRAQPGSAAAAAQGLEEACDKVASCLTELADNWTSTCDWMRQQAELDADEVLTPVSGTAGVLKPCSVAVQ